MPQQLEGKTVRITVEPWLCKEKGMVTNEAEGTVKKQVPKAILLIFEDGEEEWFPLSQITIDSVI